MLNITRVGVDLAKNVIQVHTVDAAGKVITNRALKHARFLAWCADLPTGCLVAIEACSGAHHWCRQLRERGFDARMIPAQFVAPYRVQGRSGKNDANDAATVCEAASRPRMNFVPPKTLAQQGILCVYRLREALKEERTACINRVRGLLAEFGVVLPQTHPPYFGSISTTYWKTPATTSPAWSAWSYKEPRNTGVSSRRISSGATSALPTTRRTTSRSNGLTNSRESGSSPHRQ